MTVAQYTSLSLIILGALLKSWNLIASFRWARRRGAEYAQAAESSQLEQKQEYRDLLRHNFDGAFVPFGAKSLRLYNFKRSYKWAEILLASTFRSSPLFVAWCAVVILAGQLFGLDEYPLKLLAAGVGFWMVLYSIGLLLEAIMWSLMAENYSVAWGLLKVRGPASTARRSRAVNDIYLLGSVVVLAVLSLSVAIAGTEKNFPGFKGFSTLPSHDPWTETLARLSTAMYYVMVNIATVGDEDVVPTEPAARSLGALTMVTVVLVLAFVVSAIASRFRNDTGDVDLPGSTIDVVRRRLWVLIPARDEAPTIAGIILAVQESRYAERYDTRILVINDRSVDGTPFVASEAGAQVISTRGMHGLGEAFKLGVETGLANGADIFLVVDADGQYLPKEAARLLELVEAGVGLAIGSRLTLRPKWMPWARYLTNRTFSRLIAVTLGQPETDTQSGFRAFSSCVARQCPTTSSFTYTQEQYVLAVRGGYRVESCAVSFEPRMHGCSRLVRSTGDYARRVLPVTIRTCIRSAKH
ncbi:glycosyltransferase [Modestobacter sp. VKM Ac-2984]|uniref:glycosyltransferase n=1 Tax=Modestobacter sp. VKM Ac-2984 TaxID=3004138 RepID=UPI0022AB24B2|nr:glycosyltransferase [Modestobacter sp. VKM Ac-2984]MCZ2815960.1 glycosyltransferase [Modestobacter sp. VKM Ac-2984]